MGESRGPGAREAQEVSLPIRFRAAAQREFDAAVDWYEKQQPGLGDEFIDDVRDALRRIAESPEARPFAQPPNRKALLSDFPYLIIYRVDATEIVVSAVFHTSRDPRRWRRRR